MGLGSKKTKKTSSVENIDRPDDDLEEERKGKNYGKPRRHDPTFKGPIHKRSCTDVICCVIFLAFLAGIGVVAYFAFSYGNPDTLLYPSDYQGQLCGVSDTVQTKPYAFYFDLLSCLSSTVLISLSCPTPQVCVKSCPNTTFSLLEVVDLYTVDWDKLICRYDIDPKAYVGNDISKILELATKELCAVYYVPSQPFAGRCLPITFADENGQTENGRNTTNEQVDTLGKLVSFVYGIEQIENLVDDFLKTWPYILAALGGTMLLCFFLLVLMQWLATFIVWAVLVAFVGLLAFGNYFTYTRYFQYRDQSKCGDFGDATFNYLDPECYLESSVIWLVFAIILSVIGGILILIILVLFNRIRLATAVIEEASRAMGMMPSTIFGPILPFILQITFAVFWAFVFVFLASIGEASYTVVDAPLGSDVTNGTACDISGFNSTLNSPAKCQFVSYDIPDYKLYLQLYMVFALLWMVNFIIALGEMILAGAFASYYWAFSKPNDIPAVAIASSLWRAIRYHLGSLAFGSLIVTIVQFIRIILEYVEKKLKGSSLDNCISRFILCCCHCLFWCLEKFIRYINRNAYIEIAIYGRSFCAAAKDAFFLLMRNILRAAVLNSITSFLLFIFKLTITLGVTVGAFYYFTWDSNPLIPIPPLNYIWAPIVVIGVFSYVIAAVFFAVYDMGVDTLFLCFLEDLERHDGSEEKPYFMSKSLMAVLGKKNKKPKKAKKKERDHEMQENAQ
ncbi:choline transporter-like protein 4 [Asterias rubens]|uniref:choline transporter-like protein 4 n=1 Tax=Asterias rubens TaxID=7604 RepID=UPI001455695F|nr:choline transporter-like protein 4 [Asterias rubens]